MNKYLQWTALINAAFYGKKEIVELLLLKGADVNAKDNDGVKYYFFNFSSIYLIIIHLFSFKNKIIISLFNCYYYYQDTAAHLAAYWGHLEVMKVLVEKGGADISMKNNDGKTALDRAKDGEETHVVKYLKVTRKSNILLLFIN